MGAKWYAVPQAVFAPTILTVLAISLGFLLSWWALAAIPFIWLGAFCSAPNMNMANGCLSYLSILIGIVLILLFKPSGFAITAGATLGYYLSSFEKIIRARPMDQDSTPLIAPVTSENVWPPPPEQIESE